METGYQSDLTLNSIRGTGNIPIENSLGGYGVTIGNGVNLYYVLLTPRLIAPYKTGLPLNIYFHKPNTGASQINIDRKGLVPLKKFDGTELVDLESGDIQTGVIYTLVFDGTVFQVLTGVQAKVATGRGIQQEVLAIEDRNIERNLVFYYQEQNKYAVLNGNMVIPIDIRLRRTGGAGQISGAVLKMPLPIETIGVISWTTLSTEGNPFFCRLSDLGVVFIEGTLSSAIDEVVLNFPTYIAKFPLQFPRTPLFNQ